MEKKTADGQIIIVLTEHPVLGALLIPYLAETSEDGTVLLMEQAFHASPETTANLSEAERRAIDIASHYTERYLMGIYSREKTVSHFLHKLSEDQERVKTVVRPFIEKKLSEMLELIRSSHLPLYQKQAGSKMLYAHHAYRVHPAPVESRFIFRTDDHSFRYKLNCFYNGEPFSLTDRKPVVVLNSSPAILLLGMDLYFFSHIESARLLPFTKKDIVSVETAQMEKYIDNILIPTARYHETTIYGLDIQEEQRTCQPELAIEDTVYNEQMLRLDFRYGDRTFPPDAEGEMKKIIYREADGRIVFFRRHPQHEAEALQQLIDSGLHQISDVHFQLSDHSPIRSITGWINQNRAMLRHTFRMTGGMENLPYCMDEIRIEQSCTDEPDWFDLRITVVVGSLRIPFSRFRKHILEGRREFLLPNGEIILLPDEWFSQYAGMLEMGVQTDKGIRLKRTYGGMLPSLTEQTVTKQFPDKNRIVLVPAPKGLKAKLRPYQQKGFSWMVHLSELNFGGCLADDMGLGKTLQTLTLLQHFYKQPTQEEAIAEETKEEEACTVPSSHQEAESGGQFQLFSDNTELLPQTGKQPDEPAAVTQRPKSRRAPRKPSSLIVVPTSLLHNWRREAKRFTTLSATEYNSYTPIPSGHPERFFGRYNLIFTSYGMMRNNIETLRDYCFEYIVLDESQYIKSSDSQTFRAAIQLQGKHRLTLTGTPIENSLKDLWAQFRFLQPDLLGDESTFQRQFITPIRQGSTHAEMQLQRLIAPFILRRSKEEVAPELPPLTEEIICCGMSEAQKELYEQEKNSLRNILLRHTRQADGQWSKFHAFSVLNGLLRLRQLSCHPRMLHPEFTGISGKTEQIIETFDTLRSEGHKVLIFSSFVQHLKLLAEEFCRRNWKYALLTGSTNNRPSEIAHFTEQKDVQAFLISLKAGGVGLNLTQADYVFIIDPWWNPAAEAQAIARAHRIGQQKQVIAYRFITQESIEEKILTLQESKRKLAETFINESDILPDLSPEEWTELLK